MDPFTIAAIGSSIYSGIKGFQQQKKGDRLQQEALDFERQRANERAPFRRQGMQALGQVEAPIDFGSQFTNTANPFAKATPSTASYGDWGRFTTSPDQIDAGMLGASDDDLAWAQDATTRKRPDGSWAYKASERNHAQNQILNKAKSNAQFAGLQPLLGQKLGAAGARNAKRRGFQPMGGG